MTPTVKRVSRAESQELTRLALLDAAIDLFIEKGVEATSIEDVAARAGFTRGAFYSNFGSKDELLLAAAEHFLTILHQAALPPGEPPADSGTAYRERLVRLRSVTHDSASIFLAEISLYAIRHPQVQEELAAMHQRQLRPAIEFVKASAAAAGVKVSPARVTKLANVAQGLTFAMHFFERLDPAIEAEASLALAMDLIFKGLKASKK